MNVVYKIEQYSTIEKRWVEMPGEPGYNEWATREEAEEQITSLDPEYQYRVAEK